MFASGHLDDQKYFLLVTLMIKNVFFCHLPRPSPISLGALFLS